MELEYRIRPVVRFVVTRWQAGEKSADGRMTCAGKSTQHGEFENLETAFHVAHALADVERSSRGYPPGDARIKFATREDAIAAMTAFAAERGPTIAHGFIEVGAPNNF